MPNLFSVLTSKIFGALAVFFFVGFATQTIRIEGFWFIVGYKEKVEVLRLDLSKIMAAQMAAQRIAEAKRDQEQATFTRLAERADNAERQIASLRDAADRYARANRVRTQAPRRPPGEPGGAGETRPTEGVDGPGADAVVLARPDYDVLVSNTERLVRSHAWAEDLIDNGLAVKSEE